MFAAIVINGLVFGGVYALLAIGFALVFGVAKIMNLSHSAFYMICAFLIYMGTTMMGLPLLLSAGLAIILSTLFGMLCYKLLFDRVKAHNFTVMIITVAVGMLFAEVLLLIFSGNPRRIPPLIPGFVEIGDVRVTYQHLLAIVTVGVVICLLWLLLSKTRLGIAIRAVSEDRQIANLMGIDVSRICMVTVGISVAMAGLAAIVVAPILSVNPMMWVAPLPAILAAVVLGGLGSIKGCIVGAFILGFAETGVVFLVPGGSFLRGAVSMAVMVIVLLFRPEGLYGVVFEEERL